MEDKIIKEFDNLYDDQSLKEYGKKIRTEIINGLEDLQKINDDFSLRIIYEESQLLFSLMRVLKSFNKDNSDEKVERLTKLFEIYTCFSSICNQIYFIRNEVKRFKSLINRE